MQCKLLVITAHVTPATGAGTSYMSLVEVAWRRSIAVAVDLEGVGIRGRRRRGGHGGGSCRWRW